MTYEATIKNMLGYIYFLAYKFGSNGHPYQKEDYIQEASLAVWRAGQTCGYDKKDSFWKKVIRNSMLDFYRTNVRKVNRAQSSYRNQIGRLNLLEENLYEEKKY